MTDLSPFSPVSDLVGTQIRDIDGSVIGRVDEFLLDNISGSIAFVQIRLDSVGVQQQEQLVVPWSCIRMADQQSGEWQLPIGKSALTSLTKTRLN